jgi:ferric-dicitrate binding protein FerR (iron transport regulator)
MANSRYYWLLAQQLQRALSPDERAELNELKAGAGDPAAERDMARLWKLTGKHQPDFQPDTEAALAKLHQKMRAAEPRQPVRLSVWQRPWAVAAGFLLLLTAGWVAFSQWGAPADTWVSTATGPGQRQTLELPDGSRVQLNENTTLTYLDGDWSALSGRLVRLSGEAFFQVAHKPEAPFRVVTETGQVQVLGTQFNVRAYAAERTTEVAVASGKVALSDAANTQRVELTAGAAALIDANGKLNRLDMPARSRMAWHSGALYLKDAELGETLKLLERYYGVSIVVRPEQIVNCPARITGEWKAQDWNNVAAYLARATQLRLEKTGEGQYRAMGNCY